MAKKDVKKLKGKRMTKPAVDKNEEEKQKRRVNIPATIVAAIITAIVTLITTPIGPGEKDFAILFKTDSQGQIITNIDAVDVGSYGEYASNTLEIDEYYSTYKMDIMVKKTLKYWQQVNLTVTDAPEGIETEVITIKKNIWQKIFQRRYSYYTLIFYFEDDLIKNGKNIETDWLKEGNYNLEITGTGGDGLARSTFATLHIQHSVSIIEPLEDEFIDEKATIKGKVEAQGLKEGYEFYLVAYLQDENVFYPLEIPVTDSESKWTSAIDLSGEEFASVSKIQLMAVVADSTMASEYKTVIEKDKVTEWKTLPDTSNISCILNTTIRPKVCVTNLSENETIGTVHEIQGTIKHLGDFGFFAVVYSYDNEMYYPQRITDISSGGEWKQTIYFGDEKDSEESFRLMFITTDEEATKELDEYIDGAEQNGNWTGIMEIPTGADTAYSVDIIREKVLPLAEGSILYPADDSIVSMVETVEGVITSKQEGVSIYLVAYSCAADRYFPLKKLTLGSNGEWSADAYFGDAGDTGNGYKLLLIAVQEDGDAIYQAYLDKCESDQNWTGMPSLANGSQTVHVVLVTRD